MAGNRKQRRQQHGSAWHWKQTDCWYYTEPGTRKRVPLFDEGGQNNFKIIFDEKSGLFWTCSTIVPEPYQPLSPLADRGFSGTPANMRRILMLNYSIECDRSSARLLRPGLW